ncbi:hypothetical protein [Haloechinothrix sp. LS1_15]|uniref:hypothetical protein n=1 Tax=Haloechinothrix sp. LS1_15 TaxID=2652248 RepID=UPI002948AD19|nr:hypothetical protein [Haloechinothrix sp. LS1_15]MDV6012190.1 hypothetical protein [Haloechinothrix sp. LS1_15]
MSTPRGDAASGAHTAGTRLTLIRELVERDPTAAADQAWAMIVEAGSRVSGDRERATAELASLFAAGSPSTGISGSTRGILVSFTVHPLVDRFFATVTTAWMPWVGKRFDAERKAGDNLLARSARWPSRIPWPRYRMREVDGRLAAFDFTTRVEPGALQPHRDVLVIDYAAAGRPAAENPKLIIQSIRDELVELVPGVHLGRMLWRTRNGGLHLLAYFALRTDGR